ncbi:MULTISPECIES: phosphoribosylglycinamide formyltransferase [unclassified Rhodanobacter]|uniref:phosphoribosylglycinamide formyltransferase n=1 Tax=unclassified Rhodanobacter TaxID=2621553 RepID=UPI0007A99246|nr:MULTISPECIES: phosphoribosylglycinamide formyltransferase [unclassified Rhodanobacter]KZC16195.1 phosphoribosylglycinamide formyltransferase [Rhodanobacter sp. FW104-R8]KZC26163.1 phosphoribosylglycinamide formyltransferase [Rhodanobacter sp. FW510-T8]KZC30026.1 phosphoribosylglycinamide formyltransferase [Rhodanobacter sp. FW510-R10]
MTTAPARVAVLASGRGSNLAALLEARERGELPVEFVLVGSDKAGAGALRLAEAANVPTLALDPRSYPDRRAFDLDLFRRVAASGTDWLVLAGFMRILDGEALKPWVGRIINIHPSLLPKYRGLHTHRRALEAGDAEHGASVHFVTAELDGGPVIAQARLAIEAGDDEERLARRLLPLEHRLLPAVLGLLAAGRLQWDGQAPRFDGQPLSAPLRLGDAGLSP